FEDEYMVKSGFMKHKRRMKRHKKAKFNRLLHRYAFRITKDEALDLPPVMDTVVRVPLSRKSAKAYSELERDLVTRIDDDQVTTPMKVTQMIRLQQLTGGYLVNDDGELIKVGNEKAEWFDE